MTIERTLSIIKPDATRRDLTGAINDRFEKKGLRIVAQKRIRLSPTQAESFYEVHAERPFYRSLVDFMTSGPVVVQVLEGHDAVALNREIMAPRTRRKPIRETIRKDFAQSIEANSVHGRILPRMPSGRSAFSSRQSKYAPSLGARFAGLISGQAKRQLAVWCEAGVDTAALLFFRSSCWCERRGGTRFGRRAVCGGPGAFDAPVRTASAIRPCGGGARLSSRLGDGFGVMVGGSMAQPRARRPACRVLAAGSRWSRRWPVSPLPPAGPLVAGGACSRNRDGCDRARHPWRAWCSGIRARLPGDPTEPGIGLVCNLACTRQRGAGLSRPCRLCRDDRDRDDRGDLRARRDLGASRGRRRSGVGLLLYLGRVRAAYAAAVISLILIITLLR